MYYTLGRYGIASIFEAADEKAAMSFAQPICDSGATETLVALKREDALKLVE